MHYKNHVSHPRTTYLETPAVYFLIIGESLETSEQISNFTNMCIMIVLLIKQQICGECVGVELTVSRVSPVLTSSRCVIPSHNLMNCYTLNCFTTDCRRGDAAQRQQQK